MMNQLFQMPRLYFSPRLAMVLAALALIGAWPSRASFDTTGDGRPVSIDYRLLKDAWDGHLDEHSLVEAAIRAGGNTSPHDLGRLLARYGQLQQQLVTEVRQLPSPRERVHAIHSLLHNSLLLEYHVDASDVAQTLCSGAYNCVSASILFVELAQRAGLDAHAVQFPEHVRAEVVIDGVTVPVEMTSVQSPFAAPSRTGRARVLSEIQLLATIYYNRGVKAFDTGDLDLAISLNTLALELDPDCRPARANLLAAINNRVVELVKQHRHLQAGELLEQGLRVAPAYKPFLANREYLRKQLP